MRYRDAGVDVDRADAIRREIGTLVAATATAAVRGLPGGFAGVMEFPAGRLLAATMDGVGTKLHLALERGRAADAAADLVYHCANDLLAHGARPVALLDYVAQARLEPATVLELVRGLSRACREVGAVLLGGETAEMPDTYLPGIADLAGCMIGALALEAPLDGRGIEAGDLLLGIASRGLHTNGYSLARRVVAGSRASLDRPLPGGDGESLGDALLAPHRWYGPALWPLLEAGPVKALAHVTGSGIAGNLARVLPEGRRARVHAGAWARPALFRWLEREGGIPEEDARRAFNLGVGMVVVCAPAEAEAAARAIARAGDPVHRIGEVESGPRGVEWEEGP